MDLILIDFGFIFYVTWLVVCAFVASQRFGLLCGLCGLLSNSRNKGEIPDLLETPSPVRITTERYS